MTVVWRADSMVLLLAVVTVDRRVDKMVDLMVACLVDN